MRELARVAFLAEAPLVVLADQVSYTRSFFLWDIMAIWTVRPAGAVVSDEVRADWSSDFGGCTEGG